MLLGLHSCGKEIDTVEPTHTLHDSLAIATKRVEDKLAWTCNNMFPARAIGFDCYAEGDGVSELGRWILDTGDKVI